MAEPPVAGRQLSGGVLGEGEGGLREAAAATAREGGDLLKKCCQCHEWHRKAAFSAAGWRGRGWCQACRNLSRPARSLREIVFLFLWRCFGA